jgi:hypothetical protein
MAVPVQSVNRSTVRIVASNVGDGSAIGTIGVADCDAPPPATTDAACGGLERGGAGRPVDAVSYFFFGGK